MIPEALAERLSAAFTRLGVAPGRRLGGIPPPFLPLLVHHFLPSSPVTQIVACRTNELGLSLRDTFLSFGLEGVLFCSTDEGLSDIPAGFSSPLEFFRLNSWAHLGQGAPVSVFICTLALLEEGLPAPGDLQRELLNIDPGQTKWSQLRAWLEEHGYQSASLVTEPGTYALRGSVIDLFPVNVPAPIRLDFMGDELENIRSFDIHSQISSGQLPSAVAVALNHDKSATSDLFSFFPGGWNLYKQAGDEEWDFSSTACPDISESLELAIEPFESRNSSPTIFTERWRELRRQAPSAKAFFVSDQSTHRARAAELLSSVPCSMESGFYPAGYSSIPLEMLLLTPAEMFRRPAHTWRAPQKAISSLAKIRQHVEALEPGDLIVHVNHGIGRYLGLTRLKVGEANQECLLIEYQGGDRVYVSTDKISLVFPFSVAEGISPELDSLQSGRWERVKRRTRRSAEEVVEQLAQLYAQRSLAAGKAHPADDDLQLEFEETFPYEETADQLQAAAEIKADLEQPRPMDRLLCGDVGFGKTEVALRAAFQVIRGGGQVAFLVPTTILADQHLISFRARLEPFAVTVGLLSRFVSPKQQRQTLAALSAGKIDLLVGTHRLLSKDVIFKNLALLIIDEEHRFGVHQKEKITTIKSSLDVLSLTATPIPRTLHFSLAGIRDISRLETPPRERIPIITSVTYFHNDLIRRAIKHELQRGGQVYFVHNQVKSINALYRELQDLLPEVTFGLAHGQMPGKELEKTMFTFARGDYQVLVCSSIIESGIDLPNVNTVLINDSHRMGLAQLYQIRGRVGRSNRQAYAYLLIRRRPQLSAPASKRLKTIERHSALGSGYAIALRDLEIRGSGNIFGLEQSGHVAALGLDLYTRIIQDVIKERDLNPLDSSFGRLNRDDITIRIFPGARIPDSFIPDPHLRLNLYRRIVALGDEREISSFSAELHDRFGPPPEEVQNLLLATELRLLAVSLGVRSINLSSDRHLLLEFAPPADSSVLLQRIERTMQTSGLHYRFSNTRQGNLTVSIASDSRSAYQLAKDTFLALASG